MLPGGLISNPAGSIPRIQGGLIRTPSDEYRFQRKGDAAYIARVYYDKPREITVRLDDKVRADSGDAIRAELVRIKDALCAEFGDIAVLR